MVKLFFRKLGTVPDWVLIEKDTIIDVSSGSKGAIESWKNYRVETDKCQEGCKFVYVGRGLRTETIDAWVIERRIEL